jgi:hypothetical protein
MRFLTEKQLVRKAVTEGLRRELRQFYTEEQVGPPAEHINQLLARIANTVPSTELPSNENR